MFHIVGSDIRSTIRQRTHISINVTQIYVSTIYFIVKQGYMFRLNVSHLQALTTFSSPDALPTLGSHSVYSCGIHLS